MIGHITLPSHLAQVAQRLNVVGVNDSADTWMMTSYVAESFVKTLAIVLAAGSRKSNPNIAHKLEYTLVRADGLGSWEQSISDCTGQAYAGYLDSDLQELVIWITKKRVRTEDEWARNAAGKCARVLELLGMPETEVPRRFTVRFLLGQLVRIRNKTKAHGAAGPDFFEKANPLYIDAVSITLENCPICHWEWFHLSVRPVKDTVKAVRLAGLDPKHVVAAECESLRPDIDGLHFRSHPRGHLFHCGELLRCNRECSKFSVPNGAYTDTGVAEFLDYGCGQVEHVMLPAYLKPPVPLPPSATEGMDDLDIFSNVFGNLPESSKHYVARPALEQELVERLKDRNHPIITLHGRGGIGKTSLALQVVHSLCADATPLFDHVLWMSARDLELRPSGASDVRRHIANLDTVCRLLGPLLDIEVSAEQFSRVLHEPQSINSSGILFIFDNFETLDDPRSLHKFLDTHTHLPNKILITSRERAFKGDYPIEVGGMEYDEAEALLKQEAIALQIEEILSDAMLEEIFDYTDGHPYVMQVLLGEIAKEGHKIPLKSLVPRRTDLLSVVFERSFNRLSTEARWTFLCTANWRSVVPELALLVVLGLRDLDAERGLEECVRLSLLTRQELSDGAYAYMAPELARHFGKRKLEGDPDRLLIREDLELVRAFGPVTSMEVSDLGTNVLVERFLNHCMERVSFCDHTAKVRLDAIVTNVAELHPRAWPRVAELRTAVGAKVEKIREALRRAVEEMPYDKDVWLKRARFEKDQGADGAMIAALVSAVDADPADINLIREVAFELCRYIDDHKHEIPPTRRGVYLASVRSHMEKVSASLDATGLSRLSWLFLLEEDLDGAWRFANEGLKRESTNNHCRRIVEKLNKQDDFFPPT